MIAIAGHYILGTANVLAGRQTDASFVVQLLVNVQADRWIAYILAGCSVGYGLNERRLRRNDIKRLTNQTSELESRINPTRTSSGLLPDGTTRGEDR